jgi:hypothetical protein
MDFLPSRRQRVCGFGDRKRDKSPESSAPLGAPEPVGPTMELLRPELDFATEALEVETVGYGDI